MPAPFHNTQIDIEQIPSQAAISFTMMKKSYLSYGIFFSFIFWLVIITLVILGKTVIGFNMPLLLERALWPVLIMAMISTIVYSYYSYFKEGYALRDKDVVYKEGLFWRSIATIPFSRIQHCEVKEGAVQRLFGLASLHIYTAGGSSSDIDIPGLSPTRANELKQLVLIKINAEELEVKRIKSGEEE